MRVYVLDVMTQRCVSNSMKTTTTVWNFLFDIKIKDHISQRFCVKSAPLLKSLDQIRRDSLNVCGRIPCIMMPYNDWPLQFYNCAPSSA